jgi:hypothetical protein
MGVSMLKLRNVNLKNQTALIGSYTIEFNDLGISVESYPKDYVETIVNDFSSRGFEKFDCDIVDSTIPNTENNEKKENNDEENSNEEDKADENEGNFHEEDGKGVKVEEEVADFISDINANEINAHKVSKNKKKGK